MADNDWHGQIRDLTTKVEQGDGCSLKATMASTASIEERYSFLNAIVEQNETDRITNQALPKLSLFVDFNSQEHVISPSGMEVVTGLIKGTPSMFFPTNEKQALVSEHDLANTSGSNLFTRTVTCQELK